MFSWYPSMWAAMRALLAAEKGAGTLLEEFREQGERWGYADAGQVHAMQLLLFAADHRVAATTLPRIEAAVGDATARGGPAVRDRWSAALAFAWAVAGRTGDARLELDRRAADGFAADPDDLAKLHQLCLGADAAHRTGHAGRRRGAPAAAGAVDRARRRARVGRGVRRRGRPLPRAGRGDRGRRRRRRGAPAPRGDPQRELGAHGWAVRGAGRAGVHTARDR